MSLLDLESTINGTRQSGKDVRTQNVTACAALANILKTSFGPYGMDKMMIDSTGNAIVTNDGATILGQFNVEHPAAKVLVELAQLQDKEVGDGTSSVVILAAELLKRGNFLVLKKVHPTTIITGFRVAMKEAISFIKNHLSVEVTSLGSDTILNVARTSMSSKIIGHDKDIFAEIIVKAIERVGRKSLSMEGKSIFNVETVNILKAIGQSQRDSTLIEGFALNCYLASNQMPRSILKAKIALLDFGLERMKVPHGVSYDLSDADQVSLIHQREEEYLKEIIDMLIKSGANVVLTSKGIDQLAVQYLVGKKVMGIRRIDKRDLRNIANATGGTVLLNLSDMEGEESFPPSALGECNLVQQEFMGENEMVVLRETKNQSSSTILLRGGNNLQLDEMERSVHDALCAVKRVLESGSVVPGGGSVEAALSIHLEMFAESLGTKEQLAILEFSDALLVIPKILAYNSAKDASDLVAKLCTLHNAAQKNAEKTNYRRFGLCLANGQVRDNVAAGVLEPTMSKIKSLQFATEAAVTIMRVDDMIKLNPKPEPEQPHDH